MILTDEQIEEFKKLAKPMMKFLSELGHPYAKAIISLDYAEVNSKSCSFTSEDYIQD